MAEAKASGEPDAPPKNAFLYCKRCVPYGKTYRAVVTEIRREYDRAFAAISAASIVGEEDYTVVAANLRILRRLARTMFEHSDQTEFGGAVNDAIYLGETYTAGSHGNVAQRLRCILQFSLDDFV
jgi:hypothetical protein